MPPPLVNIGHFFFLLLTQISNKKKVVVVLTNASLETIKTKHGIELVTGDTHAIHLKKINKNPADYRPDIVHQALLQLLDSPLNKAGHLEVFVQTNQNVLIQISPHVRLPRTFKRFAGLMVQLLYKLKVSFRFQNDHSTCFYSWEKCY